LSFPQGLADIDEAFFCAGILRSMQICPQTRHSIRAIDIFFNRHKYFCNETSTARLVG